MCYVSFPISLTKGCAKGHHFSFGGVTNLLLEGYVGLKQCLCKVIGGVDDFFVARSHFLGTWLLRGSDGDYGDKLMLLPLKLQNI